MMREDDDDNLSAADVRRGSHLSWSAYSIPCCWLQRGIPELGCASGVLHLSLS
ncbi:hypothetical protein [Paenibacillus popilliae]|uniref:hypothetical protein n=1 Tax=Paenibacillus popilliae TaxID=78057 RepID=UPI00131F4263|nr:hypothetical protein [Paenibacillus popilliae]